MPFCKGNRELVNFKESNIQIEDLKDIIMGIMRCWGKFDVVQCVHMTRTKYNRHQDLRME